MLAKSVEVAELVELENVARQNISNVNSDIVVKGLRYFVCGERDCRLENNESPTIFKYVKVGKW